MMSELNDFQFKVILQCEQEEFNPTRKQYCEYLVEMNGVERPLRDILKENIEQQSIIEQLRQSQDVKEFSALFNQSIALQRKIKDLKEENEQLRKELEKEKSLREYSDSMYGADLIVNIRFSNGEWKADVSVIDDE